MVTAAYPLPPIVWTRLLPSTRESRWHAVPAGSYPTGPTLCGRPRGRGFRDCRLALRPDDDACAVCRRRLPVTT